MDTQLLCLKCGKKATWYELFRNRGWCDRCVRRAPKRGRVEKGERK